MGNENSYVIDIWANVVTEFLTRLGPQDDELATILKGHLFIEYLLDKIISTKCKSPKRILSDSRSFTFAVKLQLVYSMGLLPDYTYRNIVKINKVRNELAHNLEFTEDKIDMGFAKDDGSEIKIKPKGKKNPRKFYLRMLCVGTLNQLASHVRANLKLSTKYEKSHLLNPKLGYRKDLIRGKK